MFVLLTGGAASGKSFFAEKMLAEMQEPRCYIAAMKPLSVSDEVKIAKQRKKHGEMGFVCLECFENIGGFSVPEGASVLLECLCHLTSNEMFGNGETKDPTEKIVSGVLRLSEKCRNIIVVTNEIGSEHGEYDNETKQYIEVLGRINARLSEKADRVYELVCGIPCELKRAVEK